MCRSWLRSPILCVEGLVNSPTCKSDCTVIDKFITLNRYKPSLVFVRLTEFSDTTFEGYRSVEINLLLYFFRILQSNFLSLESLTSMSENETFSWDFALSGGNCRDLFYLNFESSYLMNGLTDWLDFLYGNIIWPCLLVSEVWKKFW